MPEEVLNELLIHEFEKETSSIRHNSFLEYLVNKSEAEISDHIICEYLKIVAYFAQPLLVFSLSRGFNQKKMILPI